MSEAGSNLVIYSDNVRSGRGPTVTHCVTARNLNELSSSEVPFIGDENSILTATIKNCENGYSTIFPMFFITTQY